MIFLPLLSHCWHLRLAPPLLASSIIFPDGSGSFSDLLALLLPTWHLAIQTAELTSLHKSITIVQSSLLSSTLASLQQASLSIFPHCGMWVPSLVNSPNIKSLYDPSPVKINEPHSL